MMTPTDDSSRLNARPRTFSCRAPALELDHLAGHHAREAVDPRDPVADFEHAPDLRPRDLGLELLDLILND